MSVIAKAFTTLASEDWTVPAGVTLLLTTEVTGPGQDGAGPTLTPGLGGVGIDAFGDGGNGTEDGTGIAGSDATYIGPGGPLTTPDTYAIGPTDVEGCSIQFSGGGGSGQFAGGGSAGNVLLTFPTTMSGTLTLGGAGQNSTLVVGAITYTAFAGGDADGDTPGTAGSYDISTLGVGVADGGSYDGTNGETGTRQGGAGGLGGEWNQVSDIPVTPGDVVTCNRNTALTELLLNSVLIQRYSFLDDTELGAGLVLSGSHVGGAPDFGGADYGGGGGSAGTATADGAAGDLYSGGQHPNLVNKGGDGGNSGNDGNGQDGALAGDAGGGAQPIFGRIGGIAKIGFGKITYSDGQTSPSQNELNTGIGLSI